jgi:outer membrane biosynthesis protein TonB
MRALLLSSLLLLGTAASAQAQAQPAPKPAAPPAQPAPKPAQPAPARRPAAAPARAAMAITVTDPRGMTLPGIQVELVGPVTRSADTNAGGQLSLTGLAAGTYRVRFSGAEVITFEKEVVLRAGQTAEVDVTLNPAPPPPPPPPAPEPAPAPAPAAPPTGPAGQPLMLPVPDLLEKDFVGNQPRRETLLSCSGNTRTTMIQLNMPLPSRLYDTADAAYYVIGGEGTVSMGGRELKLQTNAFVSVPRGTPHSFTRGGRRPLILLAVLSGAPCEEAR